MLFRFPDPPWLPENKCFQSFHRLFCLCALSILQRRDKISVVSHYSKQWHAYRQMRKGFIYSLSFGSHQSWCWLFLTFIFLYLSSFGGQVSYLVTSCQISHIPRILLEPTQQDPPLAAGLSRWKSQTCVLGAQGHSSYLPWGKKPPHSLTDAHMNTWINIQILMLHLNLRTSLLNHG